jgi:neutral ceramidase
MKTVHFLAASFLVLSLAIQPGKSFGISGKLFAGTSKINITSKSDNALHDSLYARCLVLDIQGVRMAFVSVDLGIYTSAQVEILCKEKYGISQLFLSSSHTHSNGKTDKPFIESQIVKCVGLAVKNMFPAKIVAGHRSFPQLGFNRLVRREDGHSRESWFSDEHYTGENPERIPFGPVDQEVGVIKIEDLNGQTRAILMNYAMHADIVCSNYETSADYPGVACRKVEEAFGGKATCLFVQGGGGDIESLIISSRRKGADDPFKSDYRTIERVGGLLAWEAIKLAQSLSPSALEETDLKCLDDSLQFIGRFKKDALYNIQISTILINSKIVIATCPGEPFIRLQLDLKKRLRDADVTPFLFGYTWREGTWPNYIPDIQSAARGGYGADQVWPEPIAVGAGESIMNKHFENFFRLNGLMRNAPGPIGFKAVSQWEIKELKP